MPDRGAPLGKTSKRRATLGVQPVDRALALGAAVLLCAVILALARGAHEWAKVPPLIWAHLFTIIAALCLTPVMLLRRRGDAAHRWLGRIWVLAMASTAALSLGITSLRPGHLSPIHLLSLFTLFMAPRIWWTAREHKVREHRNAVRLMVSGALLIAGFFTFPFGRLLGRWLFGA